MGLHSCVEVREPIELSFGVVSGVGPGIDIRNGVYVPQGLFLGFFGICAPTGLNGQHDVLVAQICIRLLCENLTVGLYPYGQDTLESMFSLFSKDSQVQDRSGGLQNICKKM